MIVYRYISKNYGVSQIKLVFNSKTEKKIFSMLRELSLLTAVTKTGNSTENTVFIKMTLYYI